MENLSIIHEFSAVYAIKTYEHSCGNHHDTILKMVVSNINLLQPVPVFRLLQWSNSGICSSGIWSYITG
jgi:hypothetical protein